MERVIVPNRGQDRGIRGQRDGRQRVAIKVEPRQELTGDMLGIGGAAAVARNEDLVSAAQGGGHGVGGADHGLHHGAVA